MSIFKTSSQEQHLCKKGNREMENLVNILIDGSCKSLSNTIERSLYYSQYNIRYFNTIDEIISFIQNESVDVVLIYDLDLLKNLRLQYAKEELPVILLADKYTVNSFHYNDYLYDNINDFINPELLEYEISHRVNLVLNRHKKIRQLIDQTNYDFLTKIPNRKYFFEKANQIYNTKDNIVMCVVDINDFKMINDTYGHLVGDFAIKSIANILKDNIKGKDIVARYGGDEFCLLLQDISEDDARNLMKNIQQKIQNEAFKILDKNIKLSISIGITSNKSISFQNMLVLADSDLFENKVSKPKVKLCTGCVLIKKEEETENV